MNTRVLRQLLSIAGILVLTACSGGGGGNGSTSGNSSSPSSSSSGGSSTTNRVCTDPNLPTASNSAEKVWVISGASISGNCATVNGLEIDTGSIDTISSSASAILASRGPATVVSEASAGSTADTFVDFTAPGKAVSSLYHGLNLQWQSKPFLSLAKYRALVGQIRVDTLRFPGGQERGQFEADASSSENDDLGLYSPYQFRLTGEDVRNYIALCNELGIEAQIEVNMTNNDPAMAAKLVDYVVNTLKYDLKYVSMGNEPEINNFEAWKYWEASNKGEAFASYLARYQTYAAAIRAVKPDLTLIFGEFTDVSPEEMDTLFQPLGGKLNSNLPGAFSNHKYATGDWGQTPDYSDYPSIENFTGSAGLARANIYKGIYNFMRQQADTRLGGGKLFIGEFGASWSVKPDSSAVHDTIAAALFAAETLETGKDLGFDGMQWFGISDPASSSPWNPSLIAVDGDAMKLRPQYYLYFLYKHLWGDVSAQISGKNRTDNLSVYASKKGDKNYLMLINRSADQAIDKVVQVTTSSGIRKLNLRAPAHSISVIQL